MNKVETSPQNHEFRDGMPLGMMLTMVAHCHDNIIREELDAIGAQKAYGQVLMHISHHNGIRQSELAKNMNFSAPTISVTVQKLADNGYVSRLPDEEDQRSSCVYLTEKGVDMTEKIKQTFKKCEKMLSKDFSADQLDTIRAFLKKMYINISEGKTKE